MFLALILSVIKFECNSNYTKCGTNNLYNPVGSPFLFPAHHNGPSVLTIQGQYSFCHKQMILKSKWKITNVCFWNLIALRNGISHKLTPKTQRRTCQMYSFSNPLTAQIQTEYMHTKPIKIWFIVLNIISNVSHKVLFGLAGLAGECSKLPDTLDSIFKTSILDRVRMTVGYILMMEYFCHSKDALSYKCIIQIQTSADSF